MNRFTGNAFRSPTVRMVSLIVVFLLLLGSGIGVWKAFATPAVREEQVALVSYEHGGEFDYLVYLKPAVSAEPGATYFRKIIDTMDVSFSYVFIPDEPLTQVTEEVEISVVLASPGNWQKELILVPRTSKTGNFTIPVPLNLSEIQAVATAIAQEIGVYGSTDVTLKASVHVVADTGSGRLEDDFVQTVGIEAEAATLQWVGNLGVVEKGFYEQSRYEHWGRFDYTIKLKPNTLFGPITLKSDSYQQRPEALAPGESYDTTKIEFMDGTFSYQFDSDQPLIQDSVTVEVIAGVQNPGYWRKTCILVPERETTGDFTTTFAVDAAAFTNLINTAVEETGSSASSYNLFITANVHMFGETDYGTIDERFSQSLTGTSTGATITWDSNLDKSQSGSISETVTVLNSVWPARAGAIIGLLLAVLIAYYVVWNYAHVKAVALTAVEAEARRAKKKHKNVIVDVEDLPQFVAEEMVASMDSLEELVKVADALLKPVIHKAEPGKHIYRVIDGIIAYEYVIRDQGVREETEEPDLGDESN